MIPKRRLGSSELEVPVVCLGTMTWGEQNTKEEAWSQLDKSLELGCNFLDTAELYPVPPTEETCGLTEAFIGEWLESRKCRDKVIIATKVAGPGRPWISACRTEPKNPNAAPTNLYRDQVRDLRFSCDTLHTSRCPSSPVSFSLLPQVLAACDGSLRRLRTNYIDLYQLHWPSRYTPLWGKSRFDITQVKPDSEVAAFEETVLALGELIRAGKIRHWGLSNETSFGVCQWCETAKRLGVPLPITIQNDFSLVDRRFETELAEACAHYKISLLPYGPLAGGTLSGKFLSGEKPEGARHTKVSMIRPNRPSMNASRWPVSREATPLLIASPLAVPPVPGPLPLPTHHGGGRQIRSPGKAAWPEPCPTGACLLQVQVVRRVDYHRRDQPGPARGEYWRLPPGPVPGGARCHRCHPHAEPESQHYRLSIR